MRVRDDASWRRDESVGTKNLSTGGHANVTSQYLQSAEQEIDSSMGNRLEYVVAPCTTSSSCARGLAVHDAAVRLGARRSRPRVPAVLSGFDGARAATLPG